jgi:hypothetical protein
MVRDENGREWTIKAGQNLDAGSEYWVGDRATFYLPRRRAP